jgi:hypothetical protein
MPDLFAPPGRTSPVTQEEMNDCYGGGSAVKARSGHACSACGLVGSGHCGFCQYCERSHSTVSYCPPVRSLATAVYAGLSATQMILDDPHDPAIEDEPLVMVKGRHDRKCPVCNAIGPDYCELVRCQWDVTDPPADPGEDDPTPERPR